MLFFLLFLLVAFALVDVALAVVVAGLEDIVGGFTGLTEGPAAVDAGALGLQDELAVELVVARDLGRTQDVELDV